MGWIVQGSNRVGWCWGGGGEILYTCPDWPTHPLVEWVPHLFPTGKQPGHGADYPPPSSAKDKERVELYVCSLSGPSWPVTGRTLPFFTPTWMEVIGQLHSPRTLPLMASACATHWVGGWMDHSVGLDALTVREVCSCARNHTQLSVP
jgi:hypothetical protein